jgi:hypothetical protein
MCVTVERGTWTIYAGVVTSLEATSLALASTARINWMCFHRGCRLQRAPVSSRGYLARTHACIACLPQRYGCSDVHFCDTGEPILFDQWQYVNNGFISLALFFLNFAIVFIFASLVFYLKRTRTDSTKYL